MKTVYLGFGSNVGNRAENIAQAIDGLNFNGVHVTRRSSMYETEPVQVLGNEWFINAAVSAKTDLMPRQLMRTLMEIEKSLGRTRCVPPDFRSVLKYPRTIDLDILLFGDSILNTVDLKIPHPRMAERRFVLVPLAEIAPEVRHPILNKTIAQLLEETPDRARVQLCDVAKALSE